MKKLKKRTFMNNYNCEIVADSLNTFGNRITTFKLTYPRIVHAELMTHRMFSRNAASSRAVPVKKMIESVKKNMFTPLAIQKAHKGMQGSDYFEGTELEQAKQLWIESAELALQQAEKMEKFGITKQLINRILEPYQYYQVLVTATEWENFFELRCPKYVPLFDKDNEYRSWKDVCEANYNVAFIKDFHILDRLYYNESQAEIHIQAIAELMWDAYNESKPKQLQAGEWHIPFGDNFNHKEIDKFAWITNKKRNLSPVLTEVAIATARCARISYETLGDNPKIDYEADIKLHDILAKSGHWSPFEHVARCMTEEEHNHYFIANPETGGHYGWCRNFKGFIQYRSLIDNGN